METASVSVQAVPPPASAVAPTRIVRGSPQAQNIQLRVAQRRSATSSDRNVMQFPAPILLFVLPPHPVPFAGKRKSRSRWHATLLPSDPAAEPPPRRLHCYQ